MRRAVLLPPPLPPPPPSTKRRASAAGSAHTQNDSDLKSSSTALFNERGTRDTPRATRSEGSRGQQEEASDDTTTMVLPLYKTPRERGCDLP